MSSPTPTPTSPASDLQSFSETFNYPNADLILRSTDNVLFRVHKTLLAVASPVFADMFGLEGNVGGPAAQSDEFVDGLRVVPMRAETAAAVEGLLTYCYPMANPRFTSLETLEPVLAAALKFQIEFAVKDLRAALSGKKYTKKQPLTVFAIAVHYNLREEAKEAAKWSLHRSLPLLTHTRVPTLSYIPASAYHELMKFRTDCESMIDRVLSIKTVESYRDKVWHNQSQNCHCGGKRFRFLENQSTATRVADAKKWWIEYMERVHSAAKVAPRAAFHSDQFVGPAVKVAECCPVCGIFAKVHLKLFGKELSGRIRSRIDRVNLWCLNFSPGSIDAEASS